MGNADDENLIPKNMDGSQVGGNGANTAQQLKAKLAGQAAATGKNEKAGQGVLPSTKDGQRQDFGDKNAAADKGDKKGVDNTAKVDKSK